jgi:polysaccharide export outer membrane protein
MTLRKLKFTLYPLFLLMVVISCASSSPTKKEMTPTPPPSFKEIESSQQVKVMNEKILMKNFSSSKDLHRDYKIGPEDLLEISVFEDEKLNKTVRVSSQGNISLPLLGILKVGGLTAYETEKEIRDLLAEKYFQNPHVNVFIREYRNQRISVMGAVEKPGVYDVSGQKTILDLLAIAGGLKEDAGQLLFLIRPVKGDEEASEGGKDPNGEIPQTYIIGLEEMLMQGNLTLNLPLVHGDVLNVPVSGKVFVGGEVNKPGGFPLRGKKMTVSQTIALAEGLNQKANGAETKIFRYSGKGTEKEILSVDVYAIQKGQAEDPYLRENDILIVPKSGMKSFLVELLDAVKGVFGFGFSLGSL